MRERFEAAAKLDDLQDVVCCDSRACSFSDVLLKGVQVLLSFGREKDPV
jgi:hypothetical protein